MVVVMVVGASDIGTVGGGRLAARPGPGPCIEAGISPKK